MVLTAGVNAVLVGFAIVIVIIALVFAAVTLLRTERKGNYLKPAAPAKSLVSTTSQVKVTPPPLLPVPAANFRVSNLAVNPLEVVEGGTVTVSIKVTNVSSTVGFYYDELKVDGKVVSSQSINLAPVESKLMIFNVVGSGVGEHKVEVGGLDGKFTIPEAKLVVLTLNIEPHQAKEREKIDVTVGVTNKGGVAGRRNLELKLNGEVVIVKEITLTPGQYESVTFEVAEAKAGEHKVEVDDLEEMFNIPAANIIVTNLDINPRNVKEGERVNITVEVANRGGVTGSHKLELKIGGIVLATQEVTVFPKTNQKVSFILSNTKSGFHQVEIGNLSDKIMVGMADDFHPL